MSSVANHSVVLPVSDAEEAVQVQTGGASVPWYVWLGVVAVTSSTIGDLWDVSWHRTIGRDTFWTPAHMAIYASGVLAGIVGIWMIVQCTFGRDRRLRDSSVSIFGLRAPFGVFVAGWGGLAMLTAGPFDNWWHNAYGLDVKIISPPHTLLLLGSRSVAIGIAFLVLAVMNRSAQKGDTSFRPLQTLFLYVGGLVVFGQMFFLQEIDWDVKLHQVLAYIVLSIAIPVLLAVLSQTSRFRWAATVAAAIYMSFVIGEILILPLFPAQPKLGPVYFPVTHMIPGKFPILLIVPAFALDLIWQRAHSWKSWKIALVSGFVFTALLFAAEWPFAEFLMSPASANRFFGTADFAYFVRSTDFDRLRQFSHPDHGAILWLGLLKAAVFASISTWIGMTFGRWMRGVQR
ncbi:MAG TPA: hypothetical protein VGM27_24975 [Acidobacteriaceae bacterium]